MRRALLRTRIELLSESTLLVKATPRWRRTTLALTTGVLCLVAAWWLFSALTASQTAWANVQHHLEQLHSISYTTTIYNREGEPTQVLKTKILNRHVSRIQFPDGQVSVIDRASGQALTLLPAERRAVVRQGVVQRDGLFEILDRLDPGQVQQQLAERPFDGRRAVGFILQSDHTEHVLWVDVQSQRPLHWEFRRRHADGSTRHTVFSDFRYDEKFDPAEFELTPPAEYRTEIQGRAALAAPLADAALQSPTLVPHVGVGLARFGMSAAEVMRVLGEPDEIDENLQAYHYYSRGLDLSISPFTGLIGVICRAQPASSLQIRDFSGQTDRGIGMGATLDEIVAAYGPADQVAGEVSNATLTYHKLHLNFSLHEGRVVFIQMTWNP